MVLRVAAHLRHVLSGVESLRVVSEGVASHEDVDRAWMLTTGMPIGPFGMLDGIGLDVVRDVYLGHYHETGDESDAPPALILEKIERGELGTKTGRGFYSYLNPTFQTPGWLKGDGG